MRRTRWSPVRSRREDDATGSYPIAETIGTITVEGSLLRMVGDIGTDLCATFRSTGPRLDALTVVDAWEVTFLGVPGVSLLADVARLHGAVVPLRAGWAVLLPLRWTGLAHLFDVQGPVSGP